MIEEEWVSEGNFRMSFRFLRFVRAGEIKMLDGEGKEILCQCGNPASTFVGAQHSFVQVFCAQCMPYVPVNMPYEPPTVLLSNLLPIKQ